MLLPGKLEASARCPAMDQWHSCYSQLLITATRSRRVSHDVLSCKCSYLEAVKPVLTPGVMTGMRQMALVKQSRLL